MLGHNQPPSRIEFARDLAGDMNKWLSDNPVIQSEDQAREAKAIRDRAVNAVKDMEDEREAKVKPLNEQVKGINEEYRPHRDTLKSVLVELLARLTAYSLHEEQKRIKAADEARKRAAEAEQRAREAEDRERLAKEEASAGVVTDIAGSTREADEAFDLYKRASREAARAERETKVRVAGGFQRALGLRDKEVLIITDPIAALNEMGMTDKVEAAILSSAREYRRITGDLPLGIIAKTERSL